MEKHFENRAKSTSEGKEPLPIIHGYARCSTSDSKQDIDRQVRELKAAGATRIWMEYEHGDAETKEQQILMWASLNPGDTVIITEPSRLSRSVQQFCEIVETIKAKRIRLQILGSITIDCRKDDPDPMTVAFLQLIAVFSELELSMIRQRVKSGMANAKAKGKQIGRPATTFARIPDQFLRYYALFQNGHLSLTELARLADISRPTAYKYIHLINDKQRRQEK